MARTTYPRDRFDEIAPETGRVGAHRAENPRMRGGVVVLWAVIAVVVLTAAGIFGALLVSGRISLTPAPVPTTSSIPQVEPVLDTTYPVLVLNATPQEGLATQVRDTIVAAGWPADIVNAGAAGSTDFPTTTIYYATPEDEAAALGLAEVIGGAEVAESAQYLPPDDPETEANESGRQLTVVLGLDRIQDPGATPTP